MSDYQVIGNRETMKALNSALQSGKVGHAYLFAGPEGIGKKTVAHYLAKRLLCRNPESTWNCECESCRRIRNQAHPDLITVHPAGNSIKIEQLRELQHQAYLSPVMGRYKIFFFPEAEKLTEAAGNSFLKILEEAPRGVIFIFTVVRADLILGTIRSRCQVYTLYPVSEEELAEALMERGFTPEEARHRAEASHGIPGLALQAETETPSDLPEFEAILQLDLLQLLKLATDLEGEERPRIIQLLRQWQLQARQSLVGLTQKGTLQSSRMAGYIGWLEKIAEMMAMVEQNVNIRLVLEDFFLAVKLG